MLHAYDITMYRFTSTPANTRLFTTPRATFTALLSVCALALPACSGGGAGTDTDASTTQSSGTTEAATTEGSTGTGTSDGTDPSVGSDGSLTEASSTGSTGGETSGSTGDATSSTGDATSSTSDTEGTGSTGALPLEIEGVYTDGFGEHDITDEMWTMSFEGSNPSVFLVTWYDNELDTLIAENDANNDFNPGLWSKFNWTYVGDQLWFCQVAFDAASQEDAEAVPDADPSDPPNGGCGDFTWSMLTPL